MTEATLHRTVCPRNCYCTCGEMACPFGASVYDSLAGVMTKCHFCAHRVDAVLAPSCVAACPTEALSLHLMTESAGASPGRNPLPGFADPAGCHPNIRFLAPRGRIRSQLLAQLLEALAR